MANTKKTDDLVKTDVAEKTADGTVVTQPGDATSGADLRVGNPREPVPHVREGAEPVTPARGADPVGTPGTAAPADADLDPVADAKARVEANARVEKRKVIIKRTYFPLDGSGALKAVEEPTPGDAVELPIEEARHLEESGVAQAVETYPFVKK